MSEQKTPGEVLYDHYHPKYVEVILWSRRTFPTRNDVFLVENPKGHVPWKLLTKECRDSYERSANGHYITRSAS
jgi:hypothetical protein